MLKNRWIIALIIMVLGTCFITAMDNKKNDMADACHTETKQIDLTINK